MVLDGARRRRSSAVTAPVTRAASTSIEAVRAAKARFAIWAGSGGASQVRFLAAGGCFCLPYDVGFSRGRLRDAEWVTAMPWAHAADLTRAGAARGGGARRVPDRASRWPGRRAGRPGRVQRAEDLRPARHLARGPRDHRRQPARQVPRRRRVRPAPGHAPGPGRLAALARPAAGRSGQARQEPAGRARSPRRRVRLGPHRDGHPEAPRALCRPVAVRRPGHRAARP